MYWSVTISLSLGVIFSSLVCLDLGWAVALMLASYVVTTVLYCGKKPVWSVLLICTFFTGYTYSLVRASLVSDEAVTPAVSEYVCKAESSLASTRLSPDHQHLVSAMLLGDRRGLSHDQKMLFREAGAQHLLALSGLHLGILVGIFGVLVLRRVRFTRWRWPALLFFLLLLWWYAIMVGLPKSLMRASLMTTLFLVGQFSYRSTRGHEVLSSTIFLMLLLDPQCVLDIGAQLSVAALVGLTVFSPALSTLFDVYDVAGDYVKPRWPWLLSLWRFFCVSFSAWLFTMPLILFYFRQFQPWQAFVGVLLVPAASVILYGAAFVLMLSLLGAQNLLDLLSAVQDWAMNVFDDLLRVCGSMPYSCVQVTNITVWHVALLYTLLATLAIPLYFRSLKVVLLAFAVCFVSLFFFVLLP